MVRCLYCGEYLPLDSDKTETIRSADFYRRVTYGDFFEEPYSSESTYRIAGSQRAFLRKQPEKKKTGGIDLCIFNADGSLNLFKFLTVFLLVDGLLLLILLNVLLLTLIF